MESPDLAALLAPEIIGDREERLGIADHDVLAAAFEPAVVLPGAEDPAHRIQGSAGHLGHVLAGDRKLDPGTFFDALARHIVTSMGNLDVHEPMQVAAE